MYYTVTFPFLFARIRLKRPLTSHQLQPGKPLSLSLSRLSLSVLPDLLLESLHPIMQFVVSRGWLVASTLKFWTFYANIRFLPNFQPLL